MSKSAPADPKPVTLYTMPHQNFCTSAGKHYQADAEGVIPDVPPADVVQLLGMGCVREEET